MRPFATWPQADTRLIATGQAFFLGWCGEACFASITFCHVPVLLGDADVCRLQQPLRPARRATWRVSDLRTSHYFFMFCNTVVIWIIDVHAQESHKSTHSGHHDRHLSPRVCSHQSRLCRPAARQHLQWHPRSKTRQPGLCLGQSRSRRKRFITEGIPGSAHLWALLDAWWCASRWQWQTINILVSRCCQDVFEPNFQDSESVIEKT